MSLAAEPLVDEKRAERRNRVLLSGVLVYGDYAFTPDRVVRNLTSRGASVRLESHLRLPAEVVLLELTTGRRHQCRVAWQRNGFVGLELLSTQDVHTAAPNDPYRRLWTDRQPRVHL